MPMIVLMAYKSLNWKSVLWISVPGLHLGLGAYHHMFREVVEVPEYGPKYHQELTAYLEPVRKAEAIEKTDSPSAIREVAQFWVNQYEQKKLSEVPRVNYFDSTMLPAKDSIHKAKQLVSGKLRRLVAAEFAEGDIYAASTDLTLALKFCRIMRTADISTYLTFCNTQKALVQAALPYFGSATEEDHQRWFALLNVKEQEEEIAKLVEADSILLTTRANNPYRRLHAQRSAKETRSLIETDADPRSLSSMVKTSPRELISTLASAKQALTSIKDRERLLAPYRSAEQASLVAQTNEPVLRAHR